MHIDKKLYQKLLSKKKQLDSYRPLSKEALQRIIKEFEIEWTYNSNAIEGNTLSLGETRLVIERGITVGGKSLREHLEAKNHVEAIKLIEDIVKKKEKLKEFTIHLLHNTILKNIDEGGRYRETPVHIVGAIFKPPLPSEIPRLMRRYMNYVNNNPDKLTTIELAAAAHYKFVFIHPYPDGNGRVARLLMNLILMQHGFPPAIILNAERKRYLAYLMEADKENLMPFMNFVAKNVDRSLSLYLNAFRKKATKDDIFIPLREAAKFCSYSQEYLSLLARRGKLDAIKIGRNWVTTERAVREYIGTLEKKANA